MQPNIPKGLHGSANLLPMARSTKRMTQEEKIREIKKKFNLHHGKGKRKKSNKKKKR